MEIKTRKKRYLPYFGEFTNFVRGSPLGLSGTLKQNGILLTKVMNIMVIKNMHKFRIQTGLML